MRCPITSQSITVTLPEELLQRLRTRAEQAERSLDDELIHVLEEAVPPEAAIPPDLLKLLDGMQWLDDDALWPTARHGMSLEAAAELEGLHLKPQAEPLPSAERRRKAESMSVWERAMLVRAEAAALLKARGYDVGQPLARA